ncbi:MAG: ferric reductase-like transmembrane domain-containing protein [Pseudomonadota bacterium]
MQTNPGLKLGCLICFALILTAAGTIPFYFESSSMLYKFGTAKLLLRTGKIFGILAVVLMMFQAVLVSRLGFLETIFGRVRLGRFHKFNGIGLTILVICHPIFILWAEGFSFFPFEKRYWPEFLGSGLLLLIIITTVTALLRQQVKLDWKKWLVSHRLSAILIFFGVFFHVSHVSQPFESGVPFMLLLAALCVALVVLVFKWVKSSGFLK